jgi:aryl-alcohol dehydrogenase-like predicted oxidoreductase
MLRALTKSPVVLPIPGTADLEHLEKNADAAQLTLSPAEMRESS